MSDLDPFATHSLRTSLFFPSSKLFVAGNPTAAGTSLRCRWLESHGVDVFERTADSLWGESAYYQTVWDQSVDLRYTWDRLTDDEQHQALTSPDVLSVVPVRHPVTRAFAAWASKFLTGEPYYEDELPDSFERLPLAIAQLDDISEHFTTFVTALAAHVAEHGWLGFDVHFWPQSALLSRVPLGQTVQLRLEDPQKGLTIVDQWLVEHGVTPTPTHVINETVVGYTPSFVSGALAGLVKVYGQDFETFDYQPFAPESKRGHVDLAWLNDVRGRNRRYGVIHERALSSRRRAMHLEDQLRIARQRVEELEASTSWRVTRPLRAASDTIRRNK